MKYSTPKFFFFALTIFALSIKSYGQTLTLLSENFSSNNYSANGWTFPNGQSPWTVSGFYTPTVATAPNAICFLGSVSYSNYSIPMVTNTLNATSVSGPVFFSCAIRLQNSTSNATGLEQLDVEYKNLASLTWSTIATYSNNIPGYNQNFSINNFILAGMSGQNFQVRFRPHGVNSGHLPGWGIDDISITGVTCPTSLQNLTITSTPTLCSGSSATLNALGGGTNFTWSPSGGNSSTAIISPTITSSYALISSFAGCTTSPVTSIITVSVFNNPTTLTTASSATSICSGSSVTLSALGASSYSWNTGANTSSTVINPTTTLTYTVTNTNSLGCVASNTVSIQVNPIPVVAAYATSSAICSGSVNNLIASGASSYTWNTGANLAIISVTPQVSTVYSVTGTDLQGCVATATVNVIVISASVSVVGTATAICAGSSATLMASGATTYTWNNSSTNAFSIVSPLQNSVYTVTATDNLGCVISKTIGLNVNPNPTVSIVASNTAICLGNSALLTANGASSYTWSNSLSGITITVSPTVTTNYSVVGISSEGCTGSYNLDSLTLVVNPLPTVTVISSTNTICSGQVLTFTANGASIYSWNFGATGSTPTLSALQNTIYTVIGTNSLQCTSATSININVLPSPTITIASSSSSICAGANFTLLANGAQTYTWNNGSQLNVLYNNPNSTTSYTVQGTNSNGCTTTKTIQIIASQYPVLTLFTSDSLICAGEPVTLSAAGAASYSWSNSQTSSAITVFPQIETTYTVTGNNNGCTTTATITQLVDECTGIKNYESSFELFSVSPNPGSGIYSVNNYNHLKKVTLEIYSCDGTSIDSIDLLEGTNKIDLSQQPFGIYYFKFRTLEKQFFLKVVKF
jgi:hypothetical protein